MGWVALWFIVLSISSLPNPYFSVLLGHASGPLAVVIVTELFRLSTATEPAVFHEPWWLTALVPAVLGPSVTMGAQGEPLGDGNGRGRDRRRFGTLAMIASTPRAALAPP